MSQVVIDCGSASFFKAAGTPIMEIPAKTSGDDTPPSRKRPAWWLLLLVIFVIWIRLPFSHWWLTISTLAICCVLACLLFVRWRD